ncbi:protease modulator HflK [Sphingomonas sp. FW199]|uniref:protease modulator HflK n=1 Tax=Sphingomonas sp. FW199 TaxID=3400217 RepID=UPI003CF27729
MKTIFGWKPRFGILNNDGGKSPWGGNGGGGGGSGGEPPRNPWSPPPGGGRPRGNASSLDEFLKRTRGGGGGPKLPVTITRNIWVLIAALVLGLYVVFTSLHSIGPQERGVVTLFGKYYETLTPGVQVTAPAPIMLVETVDVDRVREERFPDGTAENLMLTGDQNIVDVTYTVRWRIKSAENFTFQIADAEGTVKAAAESAMRAAIANVSLNQAIGDGRGAIEVDVQNRMQAMLDEYRSGVEVLGVAVNQATAPAAVDDAFKEVTASQQQAQANVNNARAYAQQVIARAQGDAAQFDKIYEQYRAAPDVTRRRIYYETMEEVLARSNKTIVETPGVAPYLPLPAVKGRQNNPPPEAQNPAAAATPAQPAQPQGGAQ